MRISKEPALLLGAAVIAGIGMVGCRSSHQSSSQPAVRMAVTPRPTGGESHYLPKAMVYRTDGDYRDKVAVTLNEDHTMIVSFPAPSDITESSSPIELADGWLLDRRGIGPNSVFTDYTYAEYRALPSTPSPAELMKRVIPGSGVTSLVELPIDMSRAWSDPSLCDTYISSGFKDCRIIVSHK